MLSALLATVLLSTGALLARAGAGGGAQVSHAHGGSSDELKQQTTWTEVCYLDLYAAEERSTLKYTKEVVTKDATGRDVYLSDGYRKDVNGKDFYYVESCYRSGGTKGQTKTSKDASSAATQVNPFRNIVDGLGIGGMSGNLVSNLAGGAPLTFGNGLPGRLMKRQNSTSGADSALDDLNRVSQAIGGPADVLDLSGAQSDSSAPETQGGSSPAAGSGGNAANAGTAGSTAGGGGGVAGDFGLNDLNPFARPSPRPTTTGPRIVRLSTVDVETAVVHSDSRHTPTPGLEDSSLFTPASAFVPGTPSLGTEAPPPSVMSPIVSTPGPATVPPPATNTIPPPSSLTVFVSTTPSRSSAFPSAATNNLFVSVGGAPQQPTGSVTTVA